MDRPNNQVKKKVLFLLEAFDKGGIEKVTLDIVNNLDPNKYDITVQTFWYGGHCQSLVNKNIKVIPFFFKRYVRGIIRLIDYLPPKLLYTLFVRGKYDVEIAASDGGAAKVISGSTNKKSKKICWVHMDVLQQGSKLKIFSSPKNAKKVYSKFNKIICVSENTKNQFSFKFGFDNTLSVVNNPIPTQNILKLSEDKCALTFDPEKFNLISVGRLAVEKGFDRLINVCHRLYTQDHLPIELYIIGDGPLKKTLNNLITQQNITNVHLLGFQKNPYTFIKQASLYICSSLNEAHPLTIGESLVLQIPVLATRCSGTCEWLEKDQCGLLVDNNEDSLYNGIKDLFSNHFLYEKLKIKTIEKSKNIDFYVSLAVWEKSFLL